MRNLMRPSVAFVTPSVQCLTESEEKSDSGNTEANSRVCAFAGAIQVNASKLAQDSAQFFSCFLIIVCIIVSIYRYDFSESLLG